jgi:phage I-like protein
MSKPTLLHSIALAQLTAVAACSMALTAGNELQLLPAGTFSARDGRPTDASAWHIDAKIARVLITAANARITPYVIDYDHQTMLAQTNGQPAPAAGWFSKVEWREGVGLFATDVQWTPRAKDMIEAGEYRFISPVIGYDKTGAVTALYMAAITNNPAIDGMSEVLLAAASAHFSASQHLPQPHNQENSVDKELRKQLGLSENATDEEVRAAVASLAAANANLTATNTALSAATPDPSKYVPFGLMQDWQNKFTKLSAEMNAARVDDVVKGALAANKLIPSQEDWAREYGAKDLAGLSAYLATATPIAALAGTQTGGKAPTEAEGGAALSANQIALCAAMGVSHDDLKKSMKQD